VFLAEGEDEAPHIEGKSLEVGCGLSTTLNDTVSWFQSFAVHQSFLNIEY
jgi:hypothetical protein